MLPALASLYPGPRRCRDRRGGRPGCARSESRRSGGLCRSHRRLFRGAAHRGRSAGEITGLNLCQWAAALGATVIGTVSTEAKAEIAHAHGCSHTILYTRQDFVAEVSRISGGEELPVVFDSVGKDTFLRSLDCLRPRGLMVTFGQASGPIDPIAPVLLSQKGSLFLTRPFLFHYSDAMRSKLPRTSCSRWWLRERCALTSTSAWRSRMPQTPTRHWKRAQPRAPPS